jgi:hypothetical protein
MQHETAGREPRLADDAWVDEFRKQLTAKLIDRLRKYARPRAYALAAAGRKVDGLYVRELVQDAIGDTWTGALSWDPAKCSLETHLVAAVRSRSHKHRRHAEAHPHDALGDDTAASRAAEEDASTVVAGAERATSAVFSREALDRIRRAAASDRGVLRILDAFAAGAQTRSDVLTAAGMKARTYDNARVRLKRILTKLSDHALAPAVRA